MHGLSEKTVGSIQGVFAKHPQIEKATLYGSRAKGNTETAPILIWSW